MNGTQNFNSYLKKNSVCSTARRLPNNPELSFEALSQEKEGKSRRRRPPAISDV
jgi:hypothetical protein